MVYLLPFNVLVNGGAEQTVDVAWGLRSRDLIRVYLRFHSGFLGVLAVQFFAFLRMAGGSLRFFSSPRR